MAKKRSTTDTPPPPPPKAGKGSRTAANRERRLAKAKKQNGKKLKVPRGSARAKRRGNFVRQEAA